MISVILPTISARKTYLDQAVEAYERTLAKTGHEIIVIEDQSTCGIAWNLGAAQAKGDFLHFSADDLVPHEGWWMKAVRVCASGYLPAPRILKPDGSLETCGSGAFEQQEGERADFTRIPFVSKNQWKKIGPSLDCHYYTDNWISWRGRRAGYETIVCRSYLFTHHSAAEGRGAGMGENQRMEHDHRVYMNATRRIA